MKRSCLWMFLADFAIWHLGPLAAAADWPTWRYDAARSAASPDDIATNPLLALVAELPPVRQAWPLEVRHRLDFDASYEPVVMSKLLFLASPNNGSVTAYKTESGEEIWKFYTEGPVRCAPAGWQGKIYVGSDDGYLYCLDANSGKQIWRSRGAPADRPDRRQIGNGHLVSFWPVRGGPVVLDGVVYFGAGVWPTFGVFLRALDANTGKLKWTNSELHYLSNVGSGGDVLNDNAAVSPQGCLVAIGDRLVIPNGRAMPAALELATGKIVYYTEGKNNGDCRVAAHGDHAFVGSNAVLDLYDLREVGSRWVRRGDNKNVKGWHPYPWHQRFDLYESPFYPYKLAEGCDAFSAFADGVAYGLKNGTFYAHDLNHTKRVPHDMDWYSQKARPLLWEPALLWQYTPPCLAQYGPGGSQGPSPGTTPIDETRKIFLQFYGQEIPSAPCIKAGPRLYSHAGRKLIAIDGLQKQPRVAWERDLDGTCTSLIAADNKLIVVTAEGGMYCFGEGSAGKTFDEKFLPLESKADVWSRKAEEIVEASGVKSGYCLVLGLKDGRLMEELLKRTELLILGVDADAKKVDGLAAVSMRRDCSAGAWSSSWGNRRKLDFPLASQVS